MKRVILRHSGLWGILLVMIMLLSLNLMGCGSDESGTTVPPSFLAPTVTATATPSPTPPPVITPTGTPSPTPVPTTTPTSTPTPTVVPTPTSTPAPVPPETVNVDMRDFVYIPAEITIREGDTIVWKNIDIEAHTITSGDWDSGVIEPGQGYSKKFDTAGTYDLRCVFHPTMVCRVNVTKSR